MAKVKQTAVIEVSSEAGRKIGGIYTVLRSKAKYLHKEFGNKYLLIGMLDEKCGEDIAFESPPSEIAKIFSKLEAEGINCKYGKWKYGDNAQIISVDARQAGEKTVEYVNGALQRDTQKNYLKFLLWKNFGVDSLMEKSWDFDENIVWCFGVGRLLEEIFLANLYDTKSTVLQCHEWIAGAALLYCKIRVPEVASVFTTHATVLGRTLASAGVDVYGVASSAKEPISTNAAYANRVEGKHQLEAAAARECTVFTTVSETVAQEVKYILGRAADIVTVNGIEYEAKKMDSQEMRVLSQHARRELCQLLEACFISYYEQRYDDALFTYISGRYEFTNKGFDLYIEALGKLNAKLRKSSKNARRVFAFVCAPSSVRGPKISIIKNYLLLDKIGDILEVLPELHGKPYINMQSSLSLLSGEIRADIENMAKGFIKDGDRPHINCYDLTYANDAIINACVKAGLTNSKDDVVKVIFYPTYMKPNDGLMNLNYYDVISAMDVGVFPSRYEPFGYTPVEAASVEDIAITSDMTGFGRFIMKKAEKGCGVDVIRMAGRSASQSSDELADRLEEYYRMTPEKLESAKRSAYRMMKHVDWGALVRNYYSAYELALEKKGKEKI
ncbi:MAG: glycogen/starch synthase [Candidatus Micrarchaeota archaeon]|nr:glycogen/starch synthase [Candidatus Micrarchaeota archaeon]